MTVKEAVHQHATQEPASTAREASQVMEIQKAIASTTQGLMVQYRTMLRQELEREVARVMEEFETAAASIEDTIAERIGAKLPTLIQQEAHSSIRDALSTITVSLVDPAWPGGMGASPPTSRRASPLSGEEILAPGQPQHVADFDLGMNEAELYESPGPEETSDFTEPADPGSGSGPPGPTGHTDDVGSGEASPESDDGPEGDVYEGTVRLRLEANRSSRQVAQFVRELRLRPHVRLMRMAGSHKEGVDIWLGLREPLQLKEVLSQMEGVSQVSESPDSSPNDQDRSLHVRLEGELGTISESPTPMLAGEGQPQAAEELVQV